MRGGKKFIEYSESKYGEAISAWERNLYVVLQGVAAVLLPFIAFASVFKTGNAIGEEWAIGVDADGSVTF